MWQILEPKGIEKVCRNLPLSVSKKYELWKDIVERDGPDKIREIPGFHDEKLKGQRDGERSSRLNLKYRVIYSVDKNRVTVFVEEITSHKY